MSQRKNCSLNYLNYSVCILHLWWRWGLSTIADPCITAVLQTPAVVTIHELLAVTGPAFSSKLDLRLEFRRLSKVSPSDNLLFVRRENFRVFEHHLKYIPSPTLCWYWQFYVENIQTEYYHHFGIFNCSTINFVLAENPIFSGCQFDGPKVNKLWRACGSQFLDKSKL